MEKIDKTSLKNDINMSKSDEKYKRSKKSNEKNCKNVEKDIFENRIDLTIAPGDTDPEN